MQKNTRTYLCPWLYAFLTMNGFPSYEPHAVVNQGPPKVELTKGWGLGTRWVGMGLGHRLGLGLATWTSPWIRVNCIHRNLPIVWSTASTPFVEKKGYMYKMGGQRKTWKLRYFVLRPGAFQYFKDARATAKPIGEVKLKNLSIFFPGLGEWWWCTWSV